MCPRCKEYYKKYPLVEDSNDPVIGKYHKISENSRSGPIQCAFENNVFSGENWCCQTMLKLREICDAREQRDRCDMAAGSFGWLRVPECDYQNGYLVMAWYKDRGATGIAKVIQEESVETLTLDTAEQIIKEYKE